MPRNLLRTITAHFILTTLFPFAMASSWPYDCPSHLDVVFPGYNKQNSSRPPPLQSMRELHHVLSNCSNIKSLKLRVGLRGCSDWPEQFLFNFPFDFPSGSHYPSQIQVLDLEGYDFGKSEWDGVQPPDTSFPYGWLPNGIMNYYRWYQSHRSTRYYEWRDLPDDQKHRTNLDLWIGAMDFSHVQKLTLRDIRGTELVVSKLMPLLTSLTSLTVRDRGARDLILALPRDSLDHLSWVVDCNRKIDETDLEAIRHHAGSLTSLERRQPELSDTRREVMTPEQLACLGNSMPKLQALTIDINRNGTWPMEELESITTHFPRVTNLTLYLELGSERRRQLELIRRLPRDEVFEKYKAGAFDQDMISGLDNMAQPLLNKTSAQELFATLRGKKVGDELVEMSLYAGDHERQNDGPIYFPSWLEGKNAWATCKVVDGETGGGSARDSREVECKGDDTVIFECRNPWDYEIDTCVDYFGVEGMQPVEILGPEAEELKKLQAEMEGISF